MYFYKSKDNNLNIHFAQEMQKPNLNTIHNHKAYEIFILFSENAVFYVEGRNYAMECGDMIIFNNRELHRISYDTSKLYSRMVFSFARDYVTPFYDENFNILGAFDNRKLGEFNLIKKNTKSYSEIRDCYEKITNCMIKNETGSDLMIKCYFVQMLVLINRVVREITKKQTRTETDDKILNILNYINENLQQPITLEKLSEKFFLSKFHISHVFKEVTGYSVNKYITYKRVMLADNLIVNGMSAADAGIAAGFNDYSNFYKAFVKIMGHSPRESKK